MRSAGCVINDYADYKYDAEVSRTIARPLATGAIARREALGLCGLLLLFAGVLLTQLNVWTRILACVGVMLAFIYPYMKRFFAVPQLVLGLAFAWGVPMAFAAQVAHLSVTAWLLFIATVCWIIAYDTLYAMVDKKDDLRLGIRSSAIFFAGKVRVAIAGLQSGTLFFWLA